MPTIEEKNKEADTAFIEWKLKDPYSGLSPALREVLTPDAIRYIVDESQMPFNQVLDEDELHQKIVTVTGDFTKTFDPEGTLKLNKRELYSLVREIIKPEHVFQMRKRTTYLPDRVYNSFLKVLKEYITPLDTTLEEWALRFLTSESIFVALPVIQAVDVNGKSFNQLTANEKSRELQPAIEVVAQRFLTNLRPVQEKFGIVLPGGRFDEAIKAKIGTFLQEKFISSLD